MTKLLRFTKALVVEPCVVLPEGVSIQPLLREQFAAWLDLRAAAFDGLIARGRSWTQRDFDREFAARGDLRGADLWSATLASQPTDGSGGIAGSVALGRSGKPPDDRAYVRWLMVASAHRRRGIGRALLATVEQCAWQRGERRITLETHTNWRDAVRLYEACGYERG